MLLAALVVVLMNGAADAAKGKYSIIGVGTLIAPSTGLLSVLCAQYEVIQSIEGRVAEVRMTFIEAGSLATPTSITDFVSAIVRAVAAGITGATIQFAADATNTTVGLPQCPCRLSRASFKREGKRRDEFAPLRFPEI